MSPISSVHSGYSIQSHFSQTYQTVLVLVSLEGWFVDLLKIGLNIGPGCFGISKCHFSSDIQLSEFHGLFCFKNIMYLLVMRGKKESSQLFIFFSLLLN